MKVYELISYLQTFNQDAEVEFWVSEDFTTKTDVVKKVFFSNDYGYDCETEEQEVNVSFDKVYSDLNDVRADAEKVLFSLEV